MRARATHTELVVDGKPFLMVAGELHNSTSSAPAYFREAMQHAKSMNVNTVIASVAWEQFEPQEGRFDYSFIDFILKSAREQQLKIVLIWFATWKNGESSYAPLWVKADTKRFFRIRNRSGETMSAISPFCTAAMEADAKAFAALMAYIKAKDTHHDIIMMQPENEAGAFSEMDYNEVALKKYGEAVPQQLVDYLVANRDGLEPELKAAWNQNGARRQGTWAELFGGQHYDAQNFFMTWQYATFMNEVCRRGKQVLPLPMYVNAWLVQFPGELPGKYPNGGPVSRVLDIYRAAAPAIDFLAPDIYLPNFREVCRMYSRPSKKNPLFIPECERTNPGKAYYALAEHDALGFGPFGIESLASDDAYALSFRILRDELLPQIQAHRGTGKMRAILKEGNEDTASVTIGSSRLAIEYLDKGKNAYGIIIQTGNDEFLVAGINFRVAFGSTTGKKVVIGEVQEGGFEQGRWVVHRYLNGDETYHNTFLFARGRSYSVRASGGSRVATRKMVPLPVLHQHLEAGLVQQQTEGPGIYRVKIYELRQ
ncbi:hypothetical protein GCM10023184_24860 [Flaviaesturariibacter amylovorans]|uniref:Beta-galactosidase n=1 Tax=Flaviaesturariibacter amylovorans TaxID=1084520 RepID=A0ABP8GZU7_9BACT